MKFEVIDNLKIKTSQGIKQFTKGQIIPVDSEKVSILIEKFKIKPIVPHINFNGDLVIPFDSAPKYHWWKSGQSVEETKKELKVR
ncbi:MAG: hypothetical protein KAJ10_04635 [Thermodesulfovibrionia bacterium]|nr:hypothetical protein [Thermodesulfovibrionia bacterium]